MVTFRLGVHALLPGLRGTNSCHVPTLGTQSTQASLSARAQSQDLVLGYWHCARILGILLDLVPSVSIAYAVADLEQKSEGAQEEEKAAGQATKTKQQQQRSGSVTAADFASHMVSLPVFSKDSDVRIISVNFLVVLYTA